MRQLQETPPSRNPQVKVLLLTRYDRLGPSSRVRFLDFIPLLREQDITVDVRPFFDDAYLSDKYNKRPISVFNLLRYYSLRFATLLQSHNYDLIWLEKEAFPWLPWWVETPLLSARPYVVDFDDAWYLHYQNGNPVARKLLGDKLGKIVQNARLTITGNKNLESWARKSGAKNILRLPSTVDMARYHPAAPPEAGRFNIGWIGSPTTATYLSPLAPVLAELAATAGTRLQLIGSGAVTLPGITPDIFPWRENTEANAIAQFDVGIMPLPSDPWSEGKCAYKLIQYMAAGLPVVASPVGMNREVVQHGVNGFLAETPEEWRQALLTLREQPELRQSMGQAGRRRCATDYSLTAIAPRLAVTLRQSAF